MSHKRSVYKGDQVKKLLEKHNFFILCQFQNSSIKDMDLFKNQASTYGLVVKSLKNNIVREALQESSHKHIKNLLQGPVYLIYFSHIKKLSDFTEASFLFVKTLYMQKTVSFLSLKWNKQFYSTSDIDKYLSYLTPANLRYTFLQTILKGSRNCIEILQHSTRSSERS